MDDVCEIEVTGSVAVIPGRARVNYGETMDEES
jgi:hypothetical protein